MPQKPQNQVQLGITGRGNSIYHISIKLLYTQEVSTHNSNTMGNNSNSFGNHRVNPTLDSTGVVMIQRLGTPGSDTNATQRITVNVSDEVFKSNFSPQMLERKSTLALKTSFHLINVVLIGMCKIFMNI